MTAREIVLATLFFALCSADLSAQVSSLYSPENHAPSTKGGVVEGLPAFVKPKRKSKLDSIILANEKRKQYNAVKYAHLGKKYPFVFSISAEGGIRHQIGGVAYNKTTAPILSPYFGYFYTYSRFTASFRFKANQIELSFAETRLPAYALSVSRADIGHFHVFHEINEYQELLVGYRRILHQTRRVQLSAGVEVGILLSPPINSYQGRYTSTPLFARHIVFTDTFSFRNAYESIVLGINGKAHWHFSRYVSLFLHLSLYFHPNPIRAYFAYEFENTRTGHREEGSTDLRMHVLQPRLGVGISVDIPFRQKAQTHQNPLHIL